MENRSRDLKILPEEAKNDTDWHKRLMNANTIQELVDLYREKGINVSQKDKEKLEGYLEKKHKEMLGDNDLAAVTGGYIPFFDECLERYDENKCYHGATIFNSYIGCPHCKLVDIKKGIWYNTTILSCAKGYFSNVEGPTTCDEFVK